MSDPNAAPVPADQLEFEEGDMNSVSTKVGTVGWPEGAENEQGVGPGQDEPEDEPEPEPTPPPTQPTQPPPSQSSEG